MHRLVLASIAPAALVTLIAGCAPTIRQHAPPQPSPTSADPIVAFLTTTVEVLVGASVDLDTGAVSQGAYAGGLCVRRRSGKVGCIELVRESPDELRLGGRWLPLPADTVAAVTAEMGRLCVLDGAGAVRCARDAGAAVKGDVVLRAEGASQLVAVGGVVCAIAAEELVCQRIDNTDPSKSTFGPVLLDRKVVAAYAGAPCVEDDGGAMMCLEERMGRVSERRSEPDVDDASLLLDVDGYIQGCILRGGKVSCTGSNSVGQVGDGSREERFELTPVALPGEATAVSYSGSHGCALSRGEAWCWGRADDFALGQAGYAASTSYPICDRGESPTKDGCASVPFRKDDVRVTPTPVKVTELGSVTALATGMGISCGLTEGGRVSCVGMGASGVFDITPPDDPAPAR